MSPRTIRRWSSVHRWSSLIATAFLFILCVTGLPLIFHDEIDRWIAGDAVAAGGAPRPTEEIEAAGQKVHPDRVIQFMVWEAATPDRVLLSMGTSATAYPATNINVAIDRATGRAIAPDARAGAMDWLVALHGQLLLGPAGPPVLGLVAIAFILSMVSGIVLYAPFMRRLPFGAIRRERQGRVRSLDWHNFLGITLAAWLLVVGGTGWINAWGGYIFQLWRVTAMAPTPADARIAPPAISVGRALAVAQAALPGHDPAIVAYPGSLMADPSHYAVYLRGRSALESRMMRAVLVDARTGTPGAMPDLPWYIGALLLSQPLHFGDYGGLGLKLVWALLDLMAIIVLWTGLRLWWRRKGT